MKILFLDTDLIIPFIPRRVPNSNVINIILRNENTNVIIEQSLNWVLIKNKVYITIESNTDFATKNKYELEIQDSGFTIYRGKLMFLEENTDLQNYNQETQSNKEYNYV